jgi:hypothetical protein
LREGGGTGNEGGVVEIDGGDRDGLGIFEHFARQVIVKFGDQIAQARIDCAD